MSGYQFTDQQLNNLNQKDAVYSVNPGFVKRKSTVLVTDKKNPGPNETNQIQTNDGQWFQIIKVDSDPKTGFEGMAFVKGRKILYNYPTISCFKM